jgi:hypothetical protein
MSTASTSTPSVVLAGLPKGGRQVAGFDAYRIACACPSASCGCYVNGKLTKSVTFNGCPSCTAPVTLANLSGFVVE